MAAFNAPAACVKKGLLDVSVPFIVATDNAVPGSIDKLAIDSPLSPGVAPGKYVGVTLRGPGKYNPEGKTISPLTLIEPPEGLVKTTAPLADAVCAWAGADKRVVAAAIPKPNWQVIAVNLLTSFTV